MARAGRFGSLPGQAPDISATVASLMEQYENARDRNIYSAWSEGGEFEGGQVTDKRLKAHFASRRDEYEKDTPDWDYWNSQLVQLNWQIDESKATLRYAQGQLSEMGMSRWYVQNAKRFNKNSEAWREAMRSAAQYKRYAQEKNASANVKSNYEIYQGHMAAVQRNLIDPGKRIERLLLDVLVVARFADPNVQSLSDLSPSEIRDMDEAISAIGTDERMFGGVDLGSKPEIAARWNKLNEAWRKQYGRDFRIEDFGLISRKTGRGYRQQIALARRYGYESDVPGIRAAAAENSRKAMVVRAARADVYDELNDVYDEIGQMVASGGNGLDMEDVRELAARASALATSAGELGDLAVSGEANAIAIALSSGRAPGEGTDIGGVDPATGLTIVREGQNGWVDVEGLPRSAQAAGVFQGVVRRAAQYASGEYVQVIDPDGGERAVKASEVVGNPEYAVYPSSVGARSTEVVKFGVGGEILIGEPVKYQPRRKVYAAVFDQFGKPVPDPANPSAVLARELPGVTYIITEDGKPLYTIANANGTFTDTPFLHTNGGYEVEFVDGTLTLKVPQSNSADAALVGTLSGTVNSGFITNPTEGEGAQVLAPEAGAGYDPAAALNGESSEPLRPESLQASSGSITRPAGSDPNSAVSQMLVSNPGEFIKEMERVGPDGLAEWVMQTTGGDFTSAVSALGAIASYAQLDFSVGRGAPVPPWVIEQAGGTLPAAWVYDRIQRAGAAAMRGDDPELAVQGAMTLSEEQKLWNDIVSYSDRSASLRNMGIDSAATGHAMAELIRLQARPGETPRETAERIRQQYGGTLGRDGFNLTEMGVKQAEFEAGLATPWQHPDQKGAPLVAPVRYELPTWDTIGPKSAVDDVDGLPVMRRYDPARTRNLDLDPEKPTPPPAPERPVAYGSDLIRAQTALQAQRANGMFPVGGPGAGRVPTAPATVLGLPEWRAAPGPAGPAPGAMPAQPKAPYQHLYEAGDIPSRSQRIASSGLTTQRVTAGMLPAGGPMAGRSGFPTFAPLVPVAAPAAPSMSFTPRNFSVAAPPSALPGFASSPNPSLYGLGRNRKNIR